MRIIENITASGTADFMAGWSQLLQENELLMTAGFAVIGLTNFGERPIPTAHLAQVLGLSVSQAEKFAEQGWPGFFGTRVEGGLITVSPERVPLAARRQLQIGDRRFGVTGCAPDVFLYAPLLRPSVAVEETCPATGRPIRIVFTPSGVESVDPEVAVVPVPPKHEVDRVRGMGTQDCNADATLCGECPFYASAEAAQGWLAAHPGGHIFLVREAWDLSVHRAWRDRMSALLKLDA